MEIEIKRSAKWNNSKKNLDSEGPSREGAERESKKAKKPNWGKPTNTPHYKARCGVWRVNSEKKLKDNNHLHQVENQGREYKCCTPGIGSDEGEDKGNNDNTNWANNTSDQGINGGVNENCGEVGQKEREDKEFIDERTERSRKTELGVETPIYSEEEYCDSVYRGSYREQAKRRKTVKVNLEIGREKWENNHYSRTKDENTRNWEKEKYSEYYTETTLWNRKVKEEETRESYKSTKRFNAMNLRENLRRNQKESFNGFVTNLSRTRLRRRKKPKTDPENSESQQGDERAFMGKLWE